MYNATTDALNWFDFADPLGVDQTYSRSLFSREISLRVNASRTDFQRKHPQLVFIKGLKVGGTTVAMALDNVARRYQIPMHTRIKEGRNRHYFVSNQSCTEGGSLWFHHGFRNGWMAKCIPYVRYVTLLREPVSQALSWETFKLSETYYRNYPVNGKPCANMRETFPIPPFAELESESKLQARLRRVSTCVHTELRKNITLQLVAHRVNQFPDDHAGEAVSLSRAWMLSGKQSGVPHIHTNSSLIIAFLQREYLLVGAVERINEFLLLLALHMGWDPELLLVRKCKLTDLDISPIEFRRYFPELMDKLVRATAVETEVYTAMKHEFDRHVSLLPPEFSLLAQQFDHRVKSFLAEQRNRTPYTWTWYEYVDGHWEDC